MFKDTLFVFRFTIEGYKIRDDLQHGAATNAAIFSQNNNVFLNN